MSITYPLYPPSTPGFQAREFIPETSVGLNESPFTRNQQVYAWPGQRTAFSLELPPMTDAEAGEWSAFFLALNGREGTFYLGDPVRAASRGTADGIWKVGSGATANSSTLPISGGTGKFSAGDWLQVGTANALLYSNTFTNAAWTKNDVTVTAAAGTNPLTGAADASKFSSTGTEGYVAQAYVSNSDVACFSVWLWTAAGTVSLSLSNGVAGDAQSITVTTTPTRFSYVLRPGSDRISQPVFIGGFSSFTSGEEIFAANAQVNPGEYPWPYVATTSAAVTETARLHRVAQVNFTGITMSSVDVFPRLRSSYTAGQMVGYIGAHGMFRLASLPTEAFDRDALARGVSFTAIEFI